MHRVVLVKRDERTGRYYAVTAGFGRQRTVSRLSTAHADARSIVKFWESNGETAEIRDLTVSH